MRKELFKKLLLVLFPLLVLAAFAYFDPNVADIGEVIKQIDPYWFIAAICSILLYYYCDTLMYQLACKSMHVPQKLGESLLTTMFGFFYSALTPFASGGQPLQVMQMRRRGIKVGVGTSILMLKFIAWQLTVTLLGIVALICIPGSILQTGVTMTVLVTVGFLVHVGTDIIAAMAFLKPDLIYRAGNAILRFLEKIKVLKNPEKATRMHATWANTIADYRAAMQFAIRHKLGMLSIFLVAVVEAVSYMAVTYFVYRGLGFHAHSIGYVVLLPGMLYIAVSFIPLPGASIASEGGFYMMFSQLFSPAARFPAVLLWRILTYYSALFLGLFAVVIDGVRKPMYPPGTKFNGECDDQTNTSENPGSEDSAANPGDSSE